MRQTRARGRVLHPRPGAVTTPAHNGGSPGSAESHGHSSLGWTSVGRRHTWVLSVVLALPPPDRCGVRAAPRPLLPSCDRAGPELTAPGSAVGGSGATALTQPASGGQLQPPPSCGFAPAQAKRETKGRGAPASRLPARSARALTSPQLRACALPLRARVSTLAPP